MKFHRPPQTFKEGRTIYFITSRTYAGIVHLCGDERKKIFKEVLFDKIIKFSAELINWIVLGNHYHLLLELTNGVDLPLFIQELHGKSSFLIKKLPSVEVINEEQITFRELTPMEKRAERRVDGLWRRLKSAPSGLSCPESLGGVYPEFAEGLGINSVEGSPRLKEAIKKGDYLLFKTLFLANTREIPFWYSYFSHVIRNENDYFRHFNYIIQNPVKHGLCKNPWDYNFSGIFSYGREYILDSLRNYPITDFGGNYD